MKNKEVVPGLEIVDKGDDDMQVIRSQIAAEELKAHVADKNRASTIIGECQAKLHNGVPIKITQEMHDLGIAGKILTMAHTAEVNQRMFAHLDREDEEDPMEGLF